MRHIPRFGNLRNFSHFYLRTRRCSPVHKTQLLFILWIARLIYLPPHQVREEKRVFVCFCICCHSVNRTVWFIFFLCQFVSMAKLISSYILAHITMNEPEKNSTHTEDSHKQNQQQTYRRSPNEIAAIAYTIDIEQSLCNERLRLRKPNFELFLQNFVLSKW